MNIIDSSAWLEYFSDGQNAENFSSVIEDEKLLIVPVITIYEVFKVVLRESTENKALQAIAAMQKGYVIELTVDLSIEASNAINRRVLRGCLKRIENLYHIPEKHLLV